MSVLNATRTLIRRIALTPVRLYQRFISPALPPSCRYAPTCSAYAIEAVTTHGIIKGGILATWRILRCNPLSRGGVDHVPPAGRWTPDPWEPPADWVGHGEGEWIPMGLPAQFLDTEQPHTERDDVSTLPTNLPVAAGQSLKTSSSTNVRSHECLN